MGKQQWHPAGSRQRYLSTQPGYSVLAGHLLGSTNGTTLSYNVTDALGSALLTFSGSAVLGEQDYGPYGNQQYTEGTIGTDKVIPGNFRMRSDDSLSKNRSCERDQRVCLRIQVIL